MVNNVCDIFVKISPFRSVIHDAVHNVTIHSIAVASQGWCCLMNHLGYLHESHVRYAVRKTMYSCT